MSEKAPDGGGQRVPSRLFLSAFFMDAGFFLMTAAVPFKVLALGGGPATLGLVAAVAAGSYVLLARLGGRWSDSPRRAGLALAGSLVLIVFALGAARTGRLGVLVALMPLMSLGKAFYWPVVETALADLSGPRGLERQVGTFNLAWSSGKTAGFAAGGLLLAGAGFGPAFLCGSLLAAIAFASLPWRGLGTAGPRSDPGAPAGGAAPGRQEAVARRYRLAAWIANLAAYGAAGVLIHHLPKWFAELGWSPGRFGAVQALIYLSQTAVFLLLVRRIRIAYRPARFLVPLGLATAILAVLPWLRGFAAFLSIAPVIGLAFGTAYAASMYHSLDAPSGRGRNAGIHESLIGLGGLLPPLLGGLAARWSGWLGAPYLLAAGFLAAALVVATLLIAPRRRAWGRATGALIVAAVLLALGGASGLPRGSAAAPAGGFRFPWERPQRPEPHYPSLLISPPAAAFRTMSPSPRLVDARDPARHREAHPPGAVNLPAGDLLSDLPGLPARLGRLGLSGTERLIVCGKDLHQEALVFWALEAMGAQDVLLLAGGLPAWEAEGLPVVSGPEPPLAESEWSAAPDPCRLATAASLAPLLGTSGVEVLDARAGGLGSTSAAMALEGSPWRAGHVPHSLPVDFLTGLDGSGVFLPAADLRRLVEETGPRPGTRVDPGAEFVVYDDGDGRGTLGYACLRLAGFSASYLPGGWPEWAKAGLPQVRIIGAGELRQRLAAERAAGEEPERPPRGFVLLDVRSEQEWRHDRIPGSVCLPAGPAFADSLEAVLARAWPGFDRRSAPAVVYCYGEECIRSRNCATVLVRAGFQRVEWLRGGIREWQALQGASLRSGG